MKRLLALALLFPLMPAMAEENSSPRAHEAALTPGGQKPGHAIHRFFTQLSKNQIQEAYADLLKGTKIAESAQDVAMLQNKTEEAIRAFGAISGSEWIETKRVGTRLSRYIFLSFGKDYPMRWRFYFYETEGESRLIDIRISDRLSEMFDEPQPLAPAVPSR